MDLTLKSWPKKEIPPHGAPNQGTVGLQADGGKAIPPESSALQAQVYSLTKPLSKTRDPVSGLSTEGWISGPCLGGQMR